MLRFILSLTVTLSLAVPTVSNGQVYQTAAPLPQVTAASADWQIKGDPVFYAGDLYYPTGPDVFFNGNVMVRVSSFLRVPLYVDSTLEPYSVIYVPVGGNMMRPYERRREGELAGTTGSRAPSFPVEPYSDPGFDLMRAVADTVVTPSVRIDEDASVPVVRVNRVVQSIPSPRSNAGIWIPFGPARWYSAGPAVASVPPGFEKVGEYHGNPVYGDDSADRIYVASVPGGLLAPYARR